MRMRHLLRTLVDKIIMINETESVHIFMLQQSGNLCLSFHFIVGGDGGS